MKCSENFLRESEIYSMVSSLTPLRSNRYNAGSLSNDLSRQHKRALIAQSALVGDCSTLMTKRMSCFFNGVGWLVGDVCLAAREGALFEESAMVKTPKGLRCNK